MSPEVREALAEVEVAFAEPIGLFMARWAQDASARARANYAMFLADATLYDGIISNVYATKRLRLLPGNERALADALALDVVAMYLTEYASDVAALGPESAALAGIAFDYAASALRSHERSAGP